MILLPSVFSQPRQFTLGSRTKLRPPPPPTSAREYTPARSAERHRPEAHCRRLSIESPAVTAMGTTFCAAWTRSEALTAPRIDRGNSRIAARRRWPRIDSNSAPRASTDPIRAAAKRSWPSRSCRSCWSTDCGIELAIGTRSLAGLVRTRRFYFAVGDDTTPGKEGRRPRHAFLVNEKRCLKEETASVWRGRDTIGGLPSDDARR